MAKLRAELVEKANGAGWLVSVAGTKSMLEFETEDEARQFASEVGWSQARRAAMQAVRRLTRRRGGATASGRSGYGAREAPIGRRA